MGLKSFVSQKLKRKQTLLTLANWIFKKYCEFMNWINFSKNKNKNKSLSYHEIIWIQCWDFIEWAWNMATSLTIWLGWLHLKQFNVRWSDSRMRNLNWKRKENKLKYQKQHHKHDTLCKATRTKTVGLNKCESFYHKE